MTETTQPDPQVARCPWCEGHPRPCADHTAAREPLTVADIPAGQGPASLYVAPDSDGDPAVWFKAPDGVSDLVIWLAGDGSGDAALRDHLAATLPHVTTEDAP